MALKEIYANTFSTDFTINFFNNASKSPKLALLAAPFFTTMEPIDILTKNNCKVLLIVRFSPITTPSALKAALEHPLVKVRYFTDDKFHTKLYIIDNLALIGSANLTNSGLKANRELSVLLRQDRDVEFEQLPKVFDELWNDADVLTEEILKDYTRAFNAQDKPHNEKAFANYLKNFVVEASPKSIVVDSDQKSKERTFIQAFRRKYDEVLIPAHNEIMEAALNSGFGRSEFRGHDPQIEMGRFLGWVRMVHGSGNAWRETPLIAAEERKKRIAHYVGTWQSTDDTVQGDMYHSTNEIENIANIRNYLCNPNELDNLDFDKLFAYLTGCHAFLERLRFAPKNLGQDLNGLERLRLDFQKGNSLESVKATIKYLLSGKGDPIERAYDCIYGRYKLNGFGEACVMELLGWSDTERPPFNNRTIRGIRLLGFDVEHLVSGA